MGGRFCSLDQMQSECEWNLLEIMTEVVLLSLKSSEDQKKGLYRKLALYSARSGGIYSC